MYLAVNKAGNNDAYLFSKKPVKSKIALSEEIVWIARRGDPVVPFPVSRFEAKRIGCKPGQVVEVELERY